MKLQLLGKKIAVHFPRIRTIKVVIRLERKLQLVFLLMPITKGDSFDTGAAYASPTKDPPRGLHLAVYPHRSHEGPSSVWEHLRGVLFVVYTLVTLGLGSTFLLPIVNALVYLGIQPIFVTRILRLGELCVFQSVLCCIELVYGVRFRFTSSSSLSALPSQRVLLISNHRSEVDWLFIWALALRCGCGSFVRVVLKQELRRIPGVGWGCRLLRFPFVRRRRGQDDDSLSSVLSSYSSSDHCHPWVFLYPEGTTLCDRTLRLGHEYAAKQQLPRKHFVLIPRVRGFEVALEAFRPDVVIDLTLGYPELREGVRPSPARMLRGQLPAQVHMHVETFSAVSVRDEGGPRRWLNARFDQKEACLEKFYQEGSFPGRAVFEVSPHRPRVLVLSTVITLLVSVMLLHCMWMYTFMKVWGVVGVFFFTFL
jgi:lysocardiolipin and lysophospholipid acyltransferase